MPLICGSHMRGCNNKRIRCLPSWQWISKNNRKCLQDVTLEYKFGRCHSVHTFAEKCLNEPAARSTVTATNADGMVNSHDGDEGVKKEWSDLVQR